MNSDNKTTNKIKRIIAIILHVVSVGAFLVAITMLYGNPNFKTGIIQLNAETYEDSAVFNQQFDEDIRMIFDYINYKEAFETEGVLDYNKEILSINGGPNTDIEYTISSLIREAKARGYEIDEEFNIISIPENQADPEYERYSTNWCSYKEEYEEDSQTIDGYIQEVLGLLSRYYKAYSRLILKPTNLYFLAKFIDTEFTNNKKLSIDTAADFGIYAYTTRESGRVETNHTPVQTQLIKLAQTCIYCYDEDYTVVVALDTKYPKLDVYREQKEDYNSQRESYFYSLILAIVSVVTALLTLVLLIIWVFKEKESEAPIKKSETSVEGRILICALAIIVVLFLNEKVLIRVMHTVTPFDYWEFAEKAMGYACIYGCVAVTVFSVLHSIKRKTLWETSFTKRCYDAVDKYIGDHSFSNRMLIGITVYIVLNAALISIAILVASHQKTLVGRFVVMGLILAFVALNMYVIFTQYKRDVMRDKIADAIKKLAKGQTDINLDLDEFDSKELDIAKDINNVSSGFDTALQEKMKSERMKTDLITNVSHDIRTPLTSIINYVDLIKRENPQDSKIIEYLDILEQKSLHLKNLTEDLLEASKVTSGTITLELADIDFAELVHQANGEFEEKFSTRGLSIVSHIPSEPVMISADGASLWRVLENVYNNAFKYASENTRVYVDMTVNEGIAEFVIKNVSANPLNISADELTERFVRGDVSRSSEGSGLGLSIAESLTKLQGGVFEIQIDGDLFKAIVRFEVIT